MSRIKGKYIAEIIINFDFSPEVVSTRVALEEMRDNVVGGKLTQELMRLCAEEVMDSRIGTLNVIQKHAEFYVENKED